MRLLPALALLLLTAAAPAQETPSLTVRFTELLQHLGNGRTPTQEEIIAANDQPQPSREDLASAVPLILKALDSADKDVRTYTLTTLAGLELTPQAPAAPDSNAPNADKTAPPPAKPAGAAPVPTIVQPSAFKSEVARALAPAIPKLGTHLTDDSEPNRLLTAQVLGGFTPNPPPADYLVLLTYLKRDDAVGPVGEAVFEAVLNLGPIPDAVADFLARYLRRSDQTAESRANLIDAIPQRPNQSRLLNKALLVYLDTDDPRVRSRLILSLSQLDLSPDVYADTKSRVDQLAANEQENLQVVNAAKAVSPCWTAPHMTIPCPAY